MVSEIICPGWGSNTRRTKAQKIKIPSLKPRLARGAKGRLRADPLHQRAPLCPFDNVVFFNFDLGALEVLILD